MEEAMTSNDGDAGEGVDSLAGDLVNLLLSAGALKRLPRTGWRLAGIKDCESVADHSFRVALLALLLGDLIQGVDRDRLLRMAVVHDLPEAMVTDLPSSAVRSIGRDAKRQGEQDAWARLLPADGVLDEWRALWEEFEDGITLEARLARVADKLEMLLQAYEYERAGFRNLDGFWDGEVWHDRDHELVQAIGAELRRRRRELDQGGER
jgi:putative hydrolase of HD superfamily